MPDFFWWRFGLIQRDHAVSLIALSFLAGMIFAFGACSGPPDHTKTQNCQTSTVR